MNNIKFMFAKNSKWKKNGKGYWVSLIIYGVNDGISKVELNNGGGWKKASKVGGKLGQQWQLPQPSNYRNYKKRTLNVRVRLGLSHWVFFSRVLNLASRPMSVLSVRGVCRSRAPRARTTARTPSTSTAPTPASATASRGPLPSASERGGRSASAPPSFAYGRCGAT